MIEGLVSTIIPVYNRPVQLREAVESVLLQDYRPIEVIIIDDSSSDGETPHVANALAQAHPALIKVARQANGGPGVAREHGRQLAQGEFIQYLDSDDLLLPGKFTAQVQALRSNQGADVAYGITYFRDASGNLDARPHKETGTRVQAMFPKFLNSRWWETATPLYRTSVCDKAGPWSPYRLEEDWEYDCRIASLGGRLVWCELPVSEHRDHGGERLSRGAALDASRLRQRAIAHTAIYGHARAYGMTDEQLEMRQFSRSLFLLARQCGAAGLADESRKLFTLAREAAGTRRASGLDFRLYAAGAGFLGWIAAGKISVRLDNMKSQKSSRKS